MFRTRIRHTRRNKKKKSETPTCRLVPVTVQQSKEKRSKVCPSYAEERRKEEEEKKQKKPKGGVDDELYSLRLYDISRRR